jgi:hypothetical protein
MSTQTPSQVGTRVKAPATNTEFQLVTTLDEHAECAAPGCHRSPPTSDDLSFTLGADLDGMAADYGNVAFCSLKCARAFVDLGTLWKLDTLEATGGEVAIYPGSPIVAHVHLDNYPEPVHSALGHDVETAFDAASSWLVDEAQTLASVDEEESIEDYSISVEYL